MKKNIFWVCGVVQSVSLGIIIFFTLNGLNNVSGDKVIGFDTQVLLSVMFPLFLWLTPYVIYSKK